MQVNKLSRAIGLACATMAAGSAFALPASSYSTSNTRDIYVSGATAQDNGILAFALQECTNGSVHKYGISNNFVYLCTAGSNLTAAGLGQPQLAIYKYSVGGSGNGVGPVNNAATLPFLDLAKIATACAAVATNITTAAAFPGLTQTYVNTVCGASSSALTTARVTRLGLSDMEPAFFDTPANTANLDSSPIATLIFGVPVSRNIYKALQAQQGLLANTFCDVVNTGTVTAAPAGVWEHSYECMPSLTQAQLTSAYTQTPQTWAAIGVTSGLADDTIYVARRVDSSGTQKTFEALVARTPNGQGNLKSCTTDVDLFVSPDSGNVTTGDAATACTTAPATVFAGSGGGDVRACLIGHNANSRGAIGILTAEDVAPGNTASWRFVKVNGGTSTARGAAPTYGDIASGVYQYWTVASFNVPAATPALAGYTAFINRFKFQMADTVGLAINQPFGKSGLMAQWELQAGFPALDFSASSVVNPWGRKVGGTVLNNCQSGKAANF